MSEIQPTPSAKDQTINRNIFKTTATAVGKRIGEKFGFIEKAKEAFKSVDKDDQFVEINGTRITYEEFKPEGKETFDPKVATVCYSGFAWSAAEKSIHVFPQAFTNSFGTRGFLVDAKTPRENPADFAKQADDLRIFFEQRGVEEFNLVSQSLGTLKTVYFAENLERHGKKVNLVILANPKGIVNKMSKLELVYKFAKDLTKIGPAERIRNEQNKIKKTSGDGPDSEIQKGFFRSILRNLKQFGLGYAPLLWDQLKALTTADPIYNRIKAPVLVFVAEKDKVAETERMAPGQKVEPVKAPTKEAQLLANRAARAQTTRGRERYLKEHFFTKAKSVRVLETSRLGSHNAITSSRAEQVSKISSIYQKKLWGQWPPVKSPAPPKAA